jgi:steroid delta-isomerase-like uncharacterized protein
MANNVANLLKENMIAANSRNMEKLLSLFTDECVYEDVALGKVNHGKEELKAFFTSMWVWSPDVKIEEKSIFTAGDWGAAEWVMSGTHTGDLPEMSATGKNFSIRGASIIQLRDGKVSRQSDYWNMASFLQQVGILPATMIPNRFGKFMMRLMMKR